MDDVVAKEGDTKPHDLRRALLRAAVASCAGILFGHAHPAAIPAFAALCFWTLVPVTLLEQWSDPRIITRRDAFVAGFACFLLAFGLLVAAALQGVYAQAVLSSQSFGAGMAAAQERLATWARGGHNDEVVFVCYFAQCVAVGRATSALLRVRGLRGDGALLWLVLVVTVPTADWLAYAALRDPNVFSPLPSVILLSTFLLAIGSVVATFGLLVVGFAADRLEQRLSERSGPRTPSE